MTTTQQDDGDDVDIDMMSSFTMLLAGDGQHQQDNDIPLPPTSTAIQMQAPSPQLLQHNYYIHSIDSNLVIRQLPSQGLSFQLWPAATTLVTLLDRHLSSPLSAILSTGQRPLRILELGSGTGLVGIAASAILGANVTVTDLPHVLPNLQFNADANSSVLTLNGGTVDVKQLRWGEAADMDAIGREYDLILASDVVYHDHLYDPLLRTLCFFLLQGGVEKKVAFVMAHLKRWKKEKAFFKQARKLFNVDMIHADSASNGSRVGVVVYHYVGKCGKITNTANN